MVAILAGVVAASALPAAQTTKKPETFRGTTVSTKPEDRETLRIDVLRWSTDAERDQLMSVLEGKGEKELFDALKTAPTVGYIWSSATSIGYSLHYALHLPLPDGGERVIVATDLRLGSWERENPYPQSGSTDYPFTLVELRLNRRGVGVGKSSLAAKITADIESKTIALQDYAKVQILIKNVRHEHSYE